MDLRRAGRLDGSGSSIVGIGDLGGMGGWGEERREETEGRRWVCGGPGCSVCCEFEVGGFGGLADLW